MKFRPCIDIHNGQVKQIVGSSLKDDGNKAEENFVSDKDGGYYATLYKNDDLKGGHIILLNPEGSEYYEADCQQAFSALSAFPDGMQIGGGMNAENAQKFIDAGASHVIVTSYVFRDGNVDYGNLEKLRTAIGAEHVVLDLSCRKKDDTYYIVTDRWQKYTEEVVNHHTLDVLSEYCDEFLVHAVDVEGKSAGIDTELAEILGTWNGKKITYAGGISCFEDLDRLKQAGHDKLDATIGSALNIFGGPLDYNEVVKYFKNME